MNGKALDIYNSTFLVELTREDFVAKNVNTITKIDIDDFLILYWMNTN